MNAAKITNKKSFNIEMILSKHNAQLINASKNLRSSSLVDLLTQL